MSKTMPLHVEQEKQLIDYFRDNPSLWCKTHRDYNNRSVRSEKLEEIARQLGLNRKDVYEKYRNLRTTFFREHKRYKAGQQPNRQPFESRWRHFHNMQFLAKEDEVLNGHANQSGNNINHSSNDSSVSDGVVLANGDSINHNNSNLATPSPSLGDDSGPAHSFSHVLTHVNSLDASNHGRLTIHTNDQAVAGPATGDLIPASNRFIAQVVGMLNNQPVYNVQEPVAVTVGNDPEQLQLATRLFNVPNLGNNVQVASTSTGNTHTINNGIPVINGHEPTVATVSSTAAVVQLHANNTNVSYLSANNALVVAGQQQQHANNLQFLPTMASTPLASSSTSSISSNSSIFTPSRKAPLLNGPSPTSTPQGATSVKLGNLASNLVAQPSVIAHRTKNVHENSAIAASNVTSNNFSPKRPAVITNNKVTLQLASPMAAAANTSNVIVASPVSAASTMSVIQNVGPGAAAAAAVAATKSQLSWPMTPSTSNNSSKTTNSTLSPDASVSPINLGDLVKAIVAEEVTKQIREEKIKADEDEDAAFCRSLAANLRLLDRGRKELAKLELQKVMVGFISGGDYGTLHRQAVPSVGITNGGNRNGDGRLEIDEEITRTTNHVVVPSSATTSVIKNGTSFVSPNTPRTIVPAPVAARRSRSSTSSNGNLRGSSPQPQYHLSSILTGVSPTSTITLRSRRNELSSSDDNEPTMGVGGPPTAKRTRSGQSPVKIDSISMAGGTRTATATTNNNNNNKLLRGDK